MSQLTLGFSHVSSIYRLELVEISIVNLYNLIAKYDHMQYAGLGMKDKLITERSLGMLRNRSQRRELNYDSPLQLSEYAQWLKERATFFRFWDIFLATVGLKVH